MKESENKRKNIKKLRISKRLVIHGVVQGVGFRYSLCAQAKSRGLTGWVRNRREGTVEAVIQGEVAQVDDLMEWAKKGPDGSRVDQVEVFEESGDFIDFSIESSF